MISFQNASDLEFTSNPQINDRAAIVYRNGLRVGLVVPHDEHARGKCYRVYDNKNLCHADCSQFGNVFPVLHGMK